MFWVFLLHYSPGHTRTSVCTFTVFILFHIWHSPCSCRKIDFTENHVPAEHWKCIKQQTLDKLKMFYRINQFYVSMYNKIQVGDSILKKLILFCSYILSSFRINFQFIFEKSKICNNFEGKSFVKFKACIQYALLFIWKTFTCTTKGSVLNNSMLFLNMIQVCIQSIYIGIHLERVKKKIESVCRRSVVTFLIKILI